MRKEHSYKKNILSPDISPTQLVLIYASKYKYYVLVGMIAVLLWEIAATGNSYIIKSIIDSISKVQNHTLPVSRIYMLVGAVSFLGLFSNLCYRTSGFLARAFFPRIRRDVRTDFFAYLHRHSHRYFSDHFAGAITNKIVAVWRALDEILWLVAWDIFPSAINIVLSLTLLFLANTIIGFATLAIIVVYAIVFFPFLKKVRKLFAISSEARSASVGKIADVVSNIWNLQSHARWWYEENRLVWVFEEEWDKQRKSWWMMEKIRLGQGIVMAIFVSCIGYLSISLWQLGKISVGDVVLVFMIAMGLLSTVRNLAQRSLDLSEKKSDIADAISTILVPHEIVETFEDATLQIKDGDILFDNATFAYDNRGDVFSSLSLHIPHGQKVGFVGVSGSGKTTLTLLLQRFYELQSGSIKISGIDISKLSFDNLRKGIAIVPQDPVLFHRSLLENISYGKDDATIEEVYEASKLAYAHDFIEALPEKYEAKVWERGVKLSGGQRQRVAIARAILKNSPILLLDEATSALDSESEELIQKALDKVMQWKTVIAIAHRLATLKNMDRIIVLEKGKIVEDGSHAELVALWGVYSKLYDKQVKGFIG